MTEITGKRLDIGFTSAGNYLISIEIDRNDRDILKTIHEEFTSSNLPFLCRFLRPKQKRSLDANAYMWVLIQKLATKIKMSKTEIYRTYIREYGDFETLTMNPMAVKRFSETWTKNGLGWFVDIVSCDGDVAQVQAYYGSSTYSTIQMSRLIDAIVTDCKEQGIETMSNFELKRLISMWKG